MTGCRFTTSRHSPVTSPLQPVPLERKESWFRENEELHPEGTLDEKNVRRVTFSEKIETIREFPRLPIEKEIKHDDDVKISIKDMTSGEIAPIGEIRSSASHESSFRIKKADVHSTERIIRDSRRKVRNILFTEVRDGGKVKEDISHEGERISEGRDNPSTQSLFSLQTKENILLKDVAPVGDDFSLEGFSSLLPPSSSSSSSSPPSSSPSSLPGTSSGVASSPSLSSSLLLPVVASSGSSSLSSLSSVTSSPSSSLPDITSPTRFKDDPEDPILKESTNRFVIFPIKYKEIWRLYKKQEASMWPAEEINFADDPKDWKKLSDDEKKYIKHVLAFFAASDGIVLENLAGRFMLDVQIPEARQFYAMQMAIEAVHAETYALLITTYFPSLREQEEIFDSINSNDSIRRKALWALKWIGPLRGTDEKALESQRKYRELWSTKVERKEKALSTFAGDVLFPQTSVPSLQTSVIFPQKKDDAIPEDAFHVSIDDSSKLLRGTDGDSSSSPPSMEKIDIRGEIEERGARLLEKIREESISPDSSGIDSEFLYAKLIDLINDLRKKPKIWETPLCQRLVEFVASEGLKKSKDEEWNSSFAQRLVAFAIVEGIFFSSSFCAIYFFKKRGLMPGLTFSNELIARDEGLHCEFACLLYSYLKKKLPQETVHAMIKEAVAEEENFVCNALPVELIGMNSTLMCQYVRFVADRLSKSLGYEKIWNVMNPFEWMDMISIQGKTNFFEKRVGDYQKHGVMDSLNKSKDSDKGGKDSFIMDGDF